MSMKRGANPNDSSTNPIFSQFAKEKPVTYGSGKPQIALEIEIEIIQSIGKSTCENVKCKYVLSETLCKLFLTASQQ